VAFRSRAENPTPLPLLARGGGRFAGDLAPDGAVYAAVLRSAHAHAALRRVDGGEARRRPGVLAVVTGNDLEPDPGPLPLRDPPPWPPRLAAALQPPLARDRVRYAGEPLAVVLADDPYRAEDALEAIAVEVSPLPAVVDPVEALAPGAPQLHPGVPRNRVATLGMMAGRRGRDGHPSPVAVVRARLTVQRQAPAPMEPRTMAARFDGGALTVWGALDDGHANRRLLGRLLGLAESDVRLVRTDVGGDFGSRGECYPEDFLIPYLALRTGRPVVWLEDRREHFAATNQARHQVHQATLVLGPGGAIAGLLVAAVHDLGAYVRSQGLMVPRATAAFLPGPYLVPRYRCQVWCAVTNTTPAGTYRGPGRFEATFVRERAVDLAARACGLDPAEMRRRNLVPPEAMPYAPGTTAFGEPLVYRAGDFRATLERALAAADYAGFRRRQAELREAGRWPGVGLATFVERAGHRSRGRATHPHGVHVALVEVDPDTGAVRVLRYLVACCTGRLEDRRRAEDQVQGGVAQGLGAALWEGVAYDPAGQLLTASLHDYAVPGPADLPPVEVLLLEDEAVFEAGTGVGESGIVGVGAAIANAVEDALWPLGVRVTGLPLTPPAVRGLVETATGAAQPEAGGAGRGARSGRRG